MSRYIFHATHSSKMPPAKTSPTMPSSHVTISAKITRSTSAAITPIRITFLRWSAGRPAASAPTTIALSPASTMSIINATEKAAKAEGEPRLEKSLTIAAQISQVRPAEGRC